MTVIAFDVNETLLDLRALDPLLGGAEQRTRWFAQMLQVAFVGGLTENYVDFPTAQRAALQMLGIGGADEIAAAMRRLPLHPDVVPALDRLTGHTLVALTNSPLPVVTEQLTHAGIADRFAAILSADQVAALKPDARAYQLVAREFDVAIAEVRLVAAHGWDIAGALAAGCRAAFVARPGQHLIPVGPQPDITGDDLVAVAEQIAD
ncbi:haloacid dehalogenase type II [Mycobacterium sp. WMMD1722]|uniref:haloacid dehalogenase type II n=1 Tax=Mycobacterium sp. WMMD1722 TaxID=3404117 RepID=UPI003BF52EB0